MADGQTQQSGGQGDGWMPPSPRRVAARALVLCAVVCRGFIEQEAATQETEALRRRILDWLGRLELLPEAEPQELAMLRAPLGRLPPQEAVDAGWRCEGLAVLAWALQVLPLPGYDQEVEPKAATEALGFLWEEEAGELLAAPNLRAAPEIERLGKQLFALHWRLVEFSLRPKSLYFGSFAKDAWFGPLDTSYVRLIQGDLAIGERPIVRADPDEVSQCASLARERHQAVNWLLGQDPLYSRVATDT